MGYLEQSESLVGYRVRIETRDAFTVKGYTLIVPPGDSEMIPRFWDTLGADGRLARLEAASSVTVPLLGLGTWDPECEKGGSRYTVCIEETEHTDFSGLESEAPLFTKRIGASDWMVFELTWGGFQSFWRDNPYVMMKKLGYRFHTGSPDLGLHYEVYPPGFDPQRSDAMEFWITVTKRKASETSDPSRE